MPIETNKSKQMFHVPKISKGPILLQWLVFWINISVGRTFPLYYYPSSSSSSIVSSSLSSWTTTYPTNVVWVVSSHSTKAAIASVTATASGKARIQQPSQKMIKRFNKFSCKRSFTLFMSTDSEQVQEDGDNSNLEGGGSNDTDTGTDTDADADTVEMDDIDNDNTIRRTTTPSKPLLEFLIPSKDCKTNRMSGTDLAYIGDVVFELYIRSKLIWPSRKTSDLQNLAVSMVRAENQSVMLARIKEEFHLTNSEMQIVVRGRNSVTKSKNRRNPAAYQDSTAFEALIGYLYITDRDRCSELFEFIETIIDD